MWGLWSTGSIPLRLPLLRRNRYYSPPPVRRIQARARRFPLILEPVFHSGFATGATRERDLITGNRVAERWPKHNIHTYGERDHKHGCDVVHKPPGGDNHQWRLSGARDYRQPANGHGNRHERGRFHENRQRHGEVVPGGSDGWTGERVIGRRQNRNLCRFGDRNQQYRGFLVGKSRTGNNCEWSIYRSRHDQHCSDRDHHRVERRGLDQVGNRDGHPDTHRGYLQPNHQ